MSTTMISAAVTTYNGEKFLEAQLDSILRQSVPVQEIVVCDDASSDRTMEILAGYQRLYPEVIKVFRNDVNKGCYRNFETALQHCSGEYIFLSDQDDIWLPEKTATLLTLLGQNPECDGAFCDSSAVDDSLKTLGFSFWKMRGFSAALQRKAAKDPLKVMLKKVPVAAHSVVLRRRALNYLLPFPELPGFYPDTWLALQLSMHSQWALTPEKLTLYRVHENNVTSPQIATVTEQLRRSRAVRSRNGIANTAHLGEVLTARMPENLPDKHRRAVKAFHRHYSRRANYSGNFIIRCAQISGETLSGRYFRYSNGLKSIVADLLWH